MEKTKKQKRKNKEMQHIREMFLEDDSSKALASSQMDL